MTTTSPPNYASLLQDTPMMSVDGGDTEQVTNYAQLLTAKNDVHAQLVVPPGALSTLTGDGSEESPILASLPPPSLPLKTPPPAKRPRDEPQEKLAQYGSLPASKRARVACAPLISRMDVSRPESATRSAEQSQPPCQKKTIGDFLDRVRKVAHTNRRAGTIIESTPPNRLNLPLSVGLNDDTLRGLAAARGRHSVLYQNPKELPETVAVPINTNRPAGGQNGAYIAEHTTVEADGNRTRILIDDPRQVSRRDELSERKFGDHLRSLAVQELAGADAASLQQSRDSHYNTIAKHFKAITLDADKRYKASLGLSGGNTGTTSASTTSRSDEASASCFTEAPQVPLIPKLTRNYLQKYLRAPLPEAGERPCKLGEQCESHAMYFHCMKVGVPLSHKQSFALREMQLPDIEVRMHQLRAAGHSIDEITQLIPRTSCLLCNRRATIMLSSRQNILVKNTRKVVVQTHCNIFGRPGEYDVDHQKICGKRFCGLLKPIVRYDRADYAPCQYTIQLTKSSSNSSSDASVPETTDLEEAHDFNWPRAGNSESYQAQSMRTVQVPGWAESAQMICDRNIDLQASRRYVSTAYGRPPVTTPWTTAKYATPPTPGYVLAEYLCPGARQPSALRLLLSTDNLSVIYEKRETLFDTFKLFLAPPHHQQSSNTDTQHQHHNPSDSSTDPYEQLFTYWSVDRSALSPTLHGWYICLLLHLLPHVEYKRQKQLNAPFGNGELRARRREHCKLKLRFWLRMHLPLCVYFAENRARYGVRGYEDTLVSSDPRFWASLKRCGYTPSNWSYEDREAAATDLYHPLDDPLYEWTETRLRHGATCYETLCTEAAAANLLTTETVLRRWSKAYITDAPLHSLDDPRLFTLALESFDKLLLAFGFDGTREAVWAVSWRQTFVRILEESRDSHNLAAAPPVPPPPPTIRGVSLIEKACSKAWEYYNDATPWKSTFRWQMFHDQIGSLVERHLEHAEEYFTASSKKERRAVYVKLNQDWWAHQHAYYIELLTEACKRVAAEDHAKTLRREACRLPLRALPDWMYQASLTILAKSASWHRQHAIWWASCFVWICLDAARDLSRRQQPEQSEDFHRSQQLNGRAAYVTCFLPLLTWYDAMWHRDGVLPSDSRVPLGALHPWPERAEDYASLPNIRPLIQHVKFWHDLAPTHPSAVVRMLSKVVPFRSGSRSLNINLANCCDRDPAMRDLLVRIARCTLLGLYASWPLTCVPPDAKQSYAAYSAFFNPQLGAAGATHLISVLRKTPRLCTYIVQEFLVHTLNPDLPQYLDIQTVVNWPRFEQLVATVTNNAVRDNMPRDAAQWTPLHTKATIDVAIEKLQSACGREVYPSIQLPPLQRIATRVTNHAVDLLVAIGKLEEIIEELEAYLYAIWELSTQDQKRDATIIADLERRGRAFLPAASRQSCPSGQLASELARLLVERRRTLEVWRYDLPPLERCRLWKRLLGIEDEHLFQNSDETDILWHDMSPEGRKRVERLVATCDDHVRKKGASDKRIDTELAELSLADFRLLQWSLRLHAAAQSVQLIPLDAETCIQTERAMIEQRYALLPEETLDERAYHVYVTFCCERVTAFARTGRGYGNSGIAYDALLGRYACNKSRASATTTVDNSLHNDDDAIVAANNAAAAAAIAAAISNKSLLSTPPQNNPTRLNSKRTIKRTSKLKQPSAAAMTPGTRFADLTIKQQRKIARRRNNQQRQLDCRARPPVLCLNLKGFRLVHGSADARQQSYQHCPRCGNLHEYVGRRWDARGYACARCWRKTRLRTEKCTHCVKLIVVPPVVRTDGPNASHPSSKGGRKGQQEARTALAAKLRNSKHTQQLLIVNVSPTDTAAAQNPFSTIALCSEHRYVRTYSSQMLQTAGAREELPPMFVFAEQVRTYQLTRRSSLRQILAYDATRKSSINRTNARRMRNARELERSRRSGYQ